MGTSYKNASNLVKVDLITNSSKVNPLTDTTKPRVETQPVDSKGAAGNTPTGMPKKMQSSDWLLVGGVAVIAAIGLFFFLRR